MITSIGEAYEQFVSENPNVKIKKSKFYALRPLHVRPVSETSHNACLCKYHSNMKFLIESLSNVLQFPNQTGDLLDISVCDQENYTCMANMCDECKNFSIQGLVDDESINNNILWKEWKDVNGRFYVSEQQGTVHDCLQEIDKQFHSFKMHCYVKRMQSRHFEDLKIHTTNETAVLQVDFAENYTAVLQDEIQSAHWHQKQVTLFTAIAWVGDNSAKPTRSFVNISDDLTHNKHSVWVFMKNIIKSLQAEFPNLKHIHVFSDGCAGQFKNRYTLLNLTYFLQDFGVDGTWNFFATSHGKGAVDGIGGTIKRIVWQLIKSRQCIVSCAKEFYECARNAMKGVTVLFTSAEHVAAASNCLNTRWERVKPIPQLHKFHCFHSVGQGVIKAALTYHGEMSTTVSLEDGEPQCITGTSTSSSDQSKNIDVGDFVLVKLDISGKLNTKKEYYAEVLNLDEENDSVVLKYMHPSSSTWIWPKKEDISMEKASVIVKKVKHPRVINNRGQFVFV